MVETIEKLTDTSFKQGIEKGVTLVDFYADWCGPCRMLSPILEKLAQELKGKAKIAKLDVENAQETSSAYNVSSIPTLILFRNGEEVGRVVGLKDAETLKKFILSAT